MALIVRIDVDRPYGKEGFIRHVASRIASDYVFPRMSSLRYLEELETILTLLNEQQMPAWVFFRKCTFPTKNVRALMDAGHHHYGLHLENSRSEVTFRAELKNLERKLGVPIKGFSKHGSGRYKYGWHHHAPYEPEKYRVWAKQAGLKLFMGNFEDPQMPPFDDNGLRCYPAAFWLEPHWRDTRQFPVEWLLHEAETRDIVMLIHPDNVTSDPEILRNFRKIIETLKPATLVLK